MGVAVAYNFVDYLIHGCKKYCNYEYYVMPDINGAGVEHARKTDHSWVKTYRNSGGSCQGVNLLENYSHGDWNAGDTDTCSDMYKGPSEMSEPELLYVNAKASTKKNLKFSVTLTKSGNKLSYPYAHSTTKTIPEAVAYALYLQEYKKAAAASETAAVYKVGSYANNHGVNHGHPLDYNYHEFGTSFNIAFGQVEEAKIPATTDEFINGFHAMINIAQATEGFVYI